MMIQSNTETASTPSSQDGVVGAAKMDPALKTAVVAALRGGQFKQGKNKLRDGDSFCCLGVICVVAGLGIDEHKDYALRADGTRNAFSSYGALTEIGIGGPARTPLIRMNDSGTPFPEIADYIEQNL